jgi:peptide/nickel transport system permease protein
MALALSLIVFFIMDFTPGDPARLILGERAGPVEIALLRADLGLDRPFPVRYARYIWGLVSRGDWGTSYRTQTPVIDEILRKFPNTLLLALLAVAASSLIGIALGTLSAVTRYSRTDRLVTVAALCFASIPSFALGMILMLIFSLYLRVLPSNGFGSWRHLILPVIALTLPASAGILRLTRAMMLETIGRDYIRTARAKGLRESLVIGSHALKNALIPVITSMGMRFGQLLGGAVITETVFAIPGIGTHLINAIRMKDTPVVLASVLFLSLFFTLIMLAVDLICVAIDPRLRVRVLGDF